MASLGVFASGAFAAAACGTDVDLGGTTDAGAFDVAPADVRPNDDAGPDAPAPVLQPCEPCQSVSDCGEGSTCAAIGGPNGFCSPLCPSGGECVAIGYVCQTEATVASTEVKSCVPPSGSCTPATGPDAATDGSPVQRCGDLVSPATTGTPCHSCNPTSSSCQPNGCYGGWWCNTYFRRCERPPTKCP